MKSTNTYLYFFLRGHGNEFSNLIGSLSDADFPISAHRHGNAYVSFSPFAYKAIKRKSFFQNSFSLDKKLQKQKFSFQN